MKSKMPGEREFLQNISHLVHRIQGGVLGFDDDASDIPLDGDQHAIINVDTFVRETDWLPEMTPAQVGRKTAVMTISDVVAKGAKATATMLSLCVPKDYSSEDAEEIVRGFSQYCMKSSIPFIGGDLGTAKDVILTGVGIGLAPPEGIIPRNGAKEDDVIAVSGPFGLTSIGFEHLLRGGPLPEELKHDVLGAVYNPHIHHDFVSALAKECVVSASMDSSDGLGITLNTMAKQSGLAFVVDGLPVPAEVVRYARENKLDLLKLAMEGGEEFILVLAIPSEKWDAALEIAEKQKVPLKEIGYAQKGDKVVYESPEGFVDISPSGYDSLKGWD